MARARQKLIRSGMSEEIEEPNTSQQGNGGGDTIKNVKAQLEGQGQGANSSLAIHSI